MQKKLIFLALTGLLCLSLAGCGQSGSTSPEGGSSPQAEAARGGDRWRRWGPDP